MATTAVLSLCGPRIAATENVCDPSFREQRPERNKVDQRLVSLGPSDGGLVAVLKGVSEGERVINGNLQKIGPGALVQPLLQ